MADDEWWRDAVIYEIYVRSFADADGDGIGDLRGIRSRLPAIRELGVDAIWLTPFYPSPQADGGYDVADYRDVDPRFGTLGDFDDLLTSAHALGLRLLVDIVANHTSSDHPWFQAAVASPAGSVERGRYLFRDGRGPNGDLPPNDWQSVFGGPAWTRAPEPDNSGSDGPDGPDGQWYLHLFAPEQPDLDWTNVEVRLEFESVLRFWLDRGVDGFRIDVANGLAKDPAMPDIAGRFAAGGLAAVGHPHWDQDAVHDIYRSWRRLSDAYPDERMFVAEAYLDSPERLARYVRPDELHTAFNFRFLLAPWNAAALREAIDRSIDTLADVGAPPTWVLSNHDVARHVTRYGGGALGTRRARAAAMLMLALPGSAYLYQGEELGLPEVTDLPDDALADPTYLRSGGADRGRDGCRVPIPWSEHQPSYGFGPGRRSWLPQPDAWADLGRQEQADDPDSMLTLYRTALEIRKVLGLGTGVMSWIDVSAAGLVPAAARADLLAFRRDGAVCLTNLGSTAVALSGLVPVGADVLLASVRLDHPTTVPPDTSIWFGVP